MSKISEWWKHLGYCWNSNKDNFRTFGIRPWRGAPFFWFCIDKSGTAVRKEDNVMPTVSIQSIIDGTRRATLDEADKAIAEVFEKMNGDISLQAECAEAIFSLRNKSKCQT